jgi:hypothetical protein
MQLTLETGTNINNINCLGTFSLVNFGVAKGETQAGKPALSVAKGETQAGKPALSVAKGETQAGKPAPLIPP